MSHEPTIIHVEPEGQSTTHLVHALLQFAMAVRYRKNVMFASLLVGVLLGGLYYVTATRFYSAKAALVVIDTGTDQSSIGMTGEGARQLNTMPTYTSLITYPKVIEGAIQYLRPEDRVDLAEAPKDKWAGILRANLSARTVRGTNIIEISYLSKDRRAAVGVVNAVVASYRDFLSRTHRGAAGEIHRMLTKKMVELEERIARTQQEVLDARTRVGDIRIRDDGRVVHPLVQRVTAFNDELIASQKDRMQLEASMEAIQKAIRNREDLQQHVMSVANVVGKEMLLRSLGFSPMAAATQAAYERDLLEDRASYRTMQEHLGPAHPLVAEKLDKIRMTEDYLRDYQRRMNEQLSQLQNTQLGPILVQMVRQKLSQAAELEQAIQKKFSQAYAEAGRLSTQLTELENKERDLKRLRGWNEQLVNKITEINLKQDGQGVRTEVVQDPKVPPGPIAPNKRRVGMLALLAGLGVGFLLVNVLDTLDDRFRSVEEMETQLGAPVLAMVRQLQTSDATGVEVLQMCIAPDAAESEAFRTLRTALALADKEASRIVISSAEPGDGKTTVLANLAVSSAQAGKKTLLIDADLRRPGLTALMGMRGVSGLSGVIRAEGDAAQTAAQTVAQAAAANIRHSGVERLDVLPSGPRPGNPAELLAGARFSELLAWAETVYDQVLIDSPPALATSDAAVIGRLVDGVVLVVQPDKNCRRQVIRATENFATLRIPLLGVVVNRLSTDSGHGYYGYGGGYGYHYDYGEEDTREEEFLPTEAPSVRSHG
jgi:capsular exopolysaccharide synthesis family protein